MEVKRKLNNATTLAYQESSNWLPNQLERLQHSFKSKTSMNLRSFSADNFRDKTQHIMNHDAFTWIQTQ